MNWSKVNVLVQPKHDDAEAKAFIVAHHGKTVGNHFVSAIVVNVVKLVGTYQSTRGDANVDVRNRMRAMDHSALPLRRSLAKVSKGFGSVMLGLGNTLCNPALFYNMHTHVRMGSTLMDKLSVK